MFLLGLQKLGKGDWRGISRNYVITRTPTQVASHAQKYFIRQSNMSRRKRRSSLFDIVADEVCNLLISLYMNCHLTLEHTYIASTLLKLFCGFTTYFLYRPFILIFGLCSQSKLQWCHKNSYLPILHKPRHKLIHFKKNVNQWNLLIPVILYLLQSQRTYNTAIQLSILHMSHILCHFGWGPTQGQSQQILMRCLSQRRCTRKPPSTWINWLACQNSV